MLRVTTIRAFFIETKPFVFKRAWSLINCDVLRDLVPFVQFKNGTKSHSAPQIFKVDMFCFLCFLFSYEFFLNKAQLLKLIVFCIVSFH